ncbi:MAG: acyl carrier protein [Polyangiaceae bacterium]
MATQAMSHDTSIEAKVMDVIQRELHTRHRRLDPTTRLVDDLGADSLSVIELRLVFEEAFDIEIPDEEASKLRTVRDAVCTVEGRVRARLVRKLPHAPSP